MSSAIPSKASSELPSLTATVIVELTVPSRAESSAPVTVTVCALSQFPLVNVKFAGLTVASPVSPEVTVKTTSVKGALSKTTVKLSVPPASVTAVLPLLSATVNPALSLSAVAAVTVEFPRES